METWEVARAQRPGEEESQRGAQQVEEGVRVKEALTLSAPEGPGGPENSLTLGLPTRAPSPQLASSVGQPLGTFACSNPWEARPRPPCSSGPRACRTG